jgi:hypothetical protein
MPQISILIILIILIIIILFIINNNKIMQFDPAIIHPAYLH